MVLSYVHFCAVEVSRLIAETEELYSETGPLNWNVLFEVQVPFVE